jgi:hypothetical protein
MSPVREQAAQQNFFQAQNSMSWDYARSDAAQAYWQTFASSDDKIQKKDESWFPALSEADCAQPQSSWDVAKAVKEMLQAGQSNKNKWVTFCVANGVAFSNSPEEYDDAFLQRFIGFCETDISLASLEESTDAGTDTTQSAQVSDEGQMPQPGDNALTDKIQDAVAKFLQDGDDEEDSDAEEGDDMDDAIQSFMGESSPLRNASGTATVPKGNSSAASANSVGMSNVPDVHPAATTAVPAPQRSSDSSKSSAKALQAAHPGILREQKQAPGDVRLSNDYTAPRSSVGSRAAVHHAPMPQRTSAPIPSAFDQQAPAHWGVNKSLGECMRDLFNGEAIPHDVRIVVDDGALCAHRFFLVRRCEFFKKRFHCGNAIPDPWQPMLEIRLEGITTDVLKHLLLYIYTGKIDYSLEEPDSLQPQELEYIIQLCTVAERFGLPVMSKLLMEEVLVPVAEVLQNSNILQERQNRDARAFHAVAMFSAAALHSAAAKQWTPAQAVDHALQTADNHIAFAPPGLGQGEFSDTSTAADKDEESMDVKNARLAANIQGSGATTLMIRNVPRNVKQKTLFKELDSTGFTGTYDFAYMPCTFGRGVESSGLGYAFVNFEDVEAVGRFVQVWHGSRRFGMHGGEAAISVSAAEHQGKDVNVRAWMKKGGRVRNPDLHPFIKGEWGDSQEAEDGVFMKLSGHNQSFLDSGGTDSISKVSSHASQPNDTNSSSLQAAAPMRPGIVRQMRESSRQHGQQAGGVEIRQGPQVL